MPKQLTFIGAELATLVRYTATMGISSPVFYATLKCVSPTRSPGMKARHAKSTIIDPQAARRRSRVLKKRQVLRLFSNSLRSVRAEAASTTLRKTMDVII
jgi:hypothetical protein